MSGVINTLHPVARSTARACCTGLVALGLILSSTTATARETGQLRVVSPEMTGWISKQTDQFGICCGGTVGALRTQTVAWNRAGGFYRVKVDNRWLFVPDEAIIKSSNRLGDAVVWVEYEGDVLSGELTPLVRCFLPASTD